LICFIYFISYIGGTIPDIVEATISSSLLWPQFIILKLEENMRLTSQLKKLHSGSPQQLRQEYEAQLKYAQMILAVGDGNGINDAVTIVNTEGNELCEVQTLMLHDMAYETEGKYNLCFIQNHLILISNYLQITLINS
jgi:PIF1-like helicase